MRRTGYRYTNFYWMLPVMEWHLWFCRAQRSLEMKEPVRCSIDVEGDGILMDEYRDRKLLDRYLEPIALKNDLQLQDIRLVMYLSQPHRMQQP